MAVLSAAVLNAIGGKSKTVRLSGETAAKQTVNHHDLSPQDYARVQRLLDGGELFVKDDRRAYAFLEEDGRLWRAVVKVTEDGSETFLVTYHRAQHYDLPAARRTMKVLEREGD